MDDVADYKKKRNKEKAKRIHDLYIAPNCRYPINLQGITREAIAKSIRERKFSKKMFDAARDQIYVLMAMDSYMRYINSEYFKTFNDI